MIHRSFFIKFHRKLTNISTVSTETSTVGISFTRTFLDTCFTCRYTAFTIITTGLIHHNSKGFKDKETPNHMVWYKHILKKTNSKSLFKHDLKVIHSHATGSIDRRSCLLSGNGDRIRCICLQIFGIRKLRNPHSTFTSVCILSLHYEGSGYVGLCNSHLWRIAIPCSNSDLLFAVGDDDI